LIAADASSLIAYLDGESARDTVAINGALEAAELVLPPPVLIELLGRDATARAYDEIATQAALLPIADGFWLRARATRRTLLTRGLRARAIDTLIAQCCIDADVALITRDADFRHFAQWCGLNLAT
jgi:predicted nucleic acid-binding protein